MARIHELSNLLANQIAAGEVIERPASVVKELVENAIDAGATQIEILVADAGESMIRVVDNGDGIDPEDVPLAFTRHATSKINDRHDLFADVTLNTTTATSNTGLMYHIKGGKQVSATPANGRRGTVVTVRDLFYNTPARLKYLKRPQTEMSRIADIMNRIALSYANIAFTVT
ncbi:DNA mismatch repair protein MutL, partial [Leuconostoc pseudomesenteroides]